METSSVKEHCTVKYISYELQLFFNQDYNFQAVHMPKKIKLIEAILLNSLMPS